MFITRKISHFFQFDTFQTTFHKEIIGGVSTFLAMLYILSVQPQMLSSSPDVNHLNDASYNMSFGGIFIPTAIAAFVATFIMYGIISKYPCGISTRNGVKCHF